MTHDSVRIKSPAMTATLTSLVAGILFSVFLPAATKTESLLWFCTLLSFISWPLLYRRTRGRLVTLAPLSSFACLTIFVFTSTALRAHRALSPPQRPSTWTAADEVLIAGSVVSTPQSAPYSNRFSLQSRVVLAGDKWAPFHSMLQVSIQGEAPQRGRTVLVRGIIHSTRPAQNPAAFDERAYLKSRGIHHTLRADTLIVLGRTPSSPGELLGRIVRSARTRVYAALKRHVGAPGPRAVLEALIVGDRAAIDEQTLDGFKETGLLHVLAVSGLHVMLVGMTVYQLARPILIRFRLSWRAVEGVCTCLTICILLAYMLIAGASASTVRAVVMASVAIGSSVVQRPTFPLHALSVAATMLLLIHPIYLFDAGFQLSFAAVTAILFAAPLMHRFFPDLDSMHPSIRALISSCSVSLFATLGTMPVLLFHFGSVSFAGLILNLAAIPLTAAALTSGLLLLLASFFWPAAADTLGYAAGFIIDMLLFLVRLGSAHFASFSLHTRPFSPVIFGLMLVSAAMFIFSIRKKRWAYLSLGLLLAAGCFTVSDLIAPRGPSMDVVFFDVGHGDATLIVLPNDRSILIDAGNRTRYSDSGRRALLPFLRRYDIRELDAAIITHPHADHYGGLASLLGTIPIRRLFVNGSPSDEFRRGALLQRAETMGTVVDTLIAGDTLAIDSSVRICVLSPSRSFARSASVNEASLIVTIQYGATSFLFLGDAERSAETRLVAHFADLLLADVVKVGHHGSRTSSSSAFLAILQDSPDFRVRWAVISTGTHEIYGLPDEEIVDRWQKTADVVHITARSGALWLTTNGQSIRSKTW